MAQRNKQLGSHMRDWTSNPSIKNPRSVFNLSYAIKGTYNGGYLYPLKPLEIIPGDTIRARLNALIRMATPIHPVMDTIKATVHFWFCPNRQVFTNWVRLMGEQANPGDSIDFLTPQVTVSGGSADNVREFFDYMGVPVANISGANSLTVNALPMRMYNRIYNEHYRDQDLQQQIPQSSSDGPDVNSDFVLRRRGKRHDYLTSAKTFQQKGPPVPLALGGLAPVVGTPDAATVNFGDQANSANVTQLKGANSGFNISQGPSVAGTVNAFADLGASTAATVTQLRQSIAIQHVLERDARGGTRYPEQLVSRFGVTDPQLLVLQRPEFLGGGSVDINIAPVPQTSNSADTPTASNAQGNLAAVGTAMINGNIGFTKSFTEHGFVIPIISIQADLTYQQGLERFWSRRERFDYFTPELANISEQPILSKEIYADGTAGDDDIWGYNGAYDDYRTGMPLICGRFKSKPVVGETLDPWHLSQQYDARPELNANFIEDNPPINRVIAVKTEPEFIMDAYMSIKAARILPLTGVPGLYRI